MCAPSTTSTSAAAGTETGVQQQGLGQDQKQWIGDIAVAGHVMLGILSGCGSRGGGCGRPQLTAWLTCVMGAAAGCRLWGADALLRS
jgi:hypothetical protein